MAIRGSNLGFTIMKIAAENAVESSKSQRAAAKATRQNAEDSVNLRRAADAASQELANVQGVVQIASSAVSAVQSVKGIGTAAKTAGQKMQMRQDMAAARASGDPQQMRDVQLPSGQTIEQRFGREGADALLSGDTSRATLEQAGFHEEEIQSLERLSFGDEITPEQASDWMIEHQGPPASFGDRLKQKLPELAVKHFDEAIKGLKKETEEPKGKALEMKDKFREISDELADADIEHQRELGEAMLGFLRGEPQSQQAGG